MTIGDTVWHPIYGRGTLRGYAPPHGVLVYFPAIDSVRRVPRIALVGGAATAAEVQPAPAPSQAAPMGPAALRRIECLRQGIPHTADAGGWSVGNANVRARVDAAIARAEAGHGSVLEVQGAYGSGKSQLARETLAVAHARGLQTFEVELDGRATTLGNRHGLLAALLASAQLPPEPGGALPPVGVGTLLERGRVEAWGALPGSLESWRSLLRYGHLFAHDEDAMLLAENYLAGLLPMRATEKELNAKLETWDLHLPNLRLKGLLAQSRANVAEHLGRILDLGVLAGAKGSVVVFDELDHDFADYRGRESKLAMLGELARVVRARPCVMLLLTREPVLDDAEHLDLEPLADAELRAITDRALDAFAEVYPMAALGVGRDALFQRLLHRYRVDLALSGWGPRFFVRAAIEACEAVRFQGLDSLALVDTQEARA